MPTPEQEARQKIDELLTKAGWQVQDVAQVNLGASRGVAIREYPLTDGAADYVLFVDRQAVGVIEAKKAGTTLSGIESQSKQYSLGIQSGVQAWHSPLPFLYESTGYETFFTNDLDEAARSRRVFAFHKPETLLAWVKDSSTLRNRLKTKMKENPPNISNLWKAQVEAIDGLEQSLADDKPRALIQMATGSGKTFTAVSFIYRLIKFGGAKRVLFLVDRSNLGRQTLREFQQYVTPDDGRKFTELYNVQHLNSNAVDPVSRVCITTIQRLYSILSGQESFDEAEEEQSLWVEAETGGVEKQAPKPVVYNPNFPIEQFDIIVTDECHRSIYNVWRQVLEYFDAHLIGLTATPSKHTLAFFNQNLVMEYLRERAVADGVNVDQRVYNIRTQITQQGSTIEANETVGKRDRLTRQMRWENLDEDLVYGANQLDRDVVSESQIRTVIKAFKDALFTEIMPGRTTVPKTLVFAKDDNHAEEIVRVIREEFGQGNEFCRKITYRVTGTKPEDLINSFRNSFYPRIAVTVDMIATGTDIKPLEVLLFMRSVKSRLLFEQMLGRGTRVINPTDLQAVTPDATFKDSFVIVDAVGVVARAKAEKETLNRLPSVSFETLLRNVSIGSRGEDTLRTLAGRLSVLENKMNYQTTTKLHQLTGGQDLSDLANSLLDAFDDGKQFEMAEVQFNTQTPTDEQLEEVEKQLIANATEPFDDPELRNFLIDLHRRNEIVVDTVSIDTVRESGFSAADTNRAGDTVKSFKQFLIDNANEITALQILYNRPYNLQGLTFQQIKELKEVLEQPPRQWSLDTLWQSFAQVESDKVRGKSGKRTLTDLVALVRHAITPDIEPELVPYTEQVNARYQAWLAQKQTDGIAFTIEQRWWLDHIVSYIGVNLQVAPSDLDNDGELFNKGGQIAAKRVFGKDLPNILAELNEKLAA